MTCSVTHTDAFLVNQLDIQSFVDAVSTHSGCSPCSANTNGDGSINQFNIQGSINCLGG